MVESVLGVLSQALFEPFSYLLSPSKRVYWVFLLSALILASIAVVIQHKRFNIREQLQALFNRRYWFNASTAVDVACLFTNNTIRVLLIVPLLGSHLAATIFVGSFFQSTFGDAPDIALSMLAVGVLYTVAFFVCEDLSRFSLHLAMHRVPWLWRLHKLHHSASVLTPLTVHRVHPIEMALYYLRGMVVFALVSGTFIYLFQGRVHGWQILGVDCLGFLFNFFGANLRHSHIQLSFGVFEKYLISPAQHQVHHSRDTAHYNKNFGTCLACWDRLFGSWFAGKTKEALVFGLTEDRRRSDSKPAAPIAVVVEAAPS